MDKLTLILNTLNNIDVHGKNNLTRLLGCIQELEEMKEAEDHDHKDEQRNV